MAAAAERSANACPYDRAVEVTIAGRPLSIPQSALTETSGTDVAGYEIRPDHRALVVDIVGRKGEVWRAPMTKLVQGKRCQGLLIGQPVRVTERLG